jgi:uncharacterized protein YggU (UPF0235/DUF167 family)
MVRQRAGRTLDVTSPAPALGKTRIVRVEILVRPSASRPRVGDAHDGALVVRVTEPAVGGRATRAALRALAAALDVPPRAVTLVRGPTSRRKVVEITSAGDDEEVLARRLRSLLHGDA